MMSNNINIFSVKMWKKKTKFGICYKLIITFELCLKYENDAVWGQCCPVLFAAIYSYLQQYMI
jgi:hypothetical protein